MPHWAKKITASTTNMEAASETEIQLISVLQLVEVRRDVILA